MMLLAFLLWLAYIIWAWYEDAELERKSQQKPVLTPKEIQERYWRKNYSSEANLPALPKKEEKPFLEGAVEPTDGSTCESDCRDCK